MEEDTGKLTHQGSETLIDFNRSGVPLVEIVTEPDFTNSSQVKDYAKKLQQIFRYLGVSNADMERGDMRLEANISVRPKGQVELPNHRVELKNINSFRFMVAAIEYEIKRQIEALEKGEKLFQETRGWNEDKKCTYVQRSKEDAHDYRYFPEPDLPELFQGTKKVQQLKDSLPELPWDMVERFEKLGLKKSDAQIFAESKELGQFFEAAVEYGKEYDVTSLQIANYLINRRESSMDIAEVINNIMSRIKGVVTDADVLEIWAKEVLTENPKFVETYKKGKTTVIMALIGAVMKKTAGKADAQKAKEILEKLLNYA